jgi:hypothetical protein
MNSKLQDLVEKFPDATNIKFFSNEGYTGIEIGVSRKGWGFGAITLSYNREKDTWHLDDECTSRVLVAQFLTDAIPHILDALYDKGDVKFFEVEP